MTNCSTAAARAWFALHRQHGELVSALPKTLPPRLLRPPTGQSILRPGDQSAGGVSRGHKRTSPLTNTPTWYRFIGVRIDPSHRMSQRTTPVNGRSRHGYQHQGVHRPGHDLRTL